MCHWGSQPAGSLGRLRFSSLGEKKGWASRYPGHRLHHALSTEDVHSAKSLKALNHAVLPDCCHGNTLFRNLSQRMLGFSFSSTAYQTSPNWNRSTRRRPASRNTRLQSTSRFTLLLRALRMPKRKWGKTSCHFITRSRRKSVETRKKKYVFFHFTVINYFMLAIHIQSSEVH